MFKKKKTAPRNSISLSPAETATLQKLQAAIKQQESTLASLKQFFADLLQERYGIDLINDNWTLDLDSGVLKRDTTTG